MLASLTEALAALQAGNPVGLTEIEFQVSLLGEDAWEAARVTRAVHFMDFGRVSRISKVYGIQSLFLDRQAEVVDLISAVGARSGPIEETFREIRRAVSVTTTMGCSLSVEYRRVQEEIRTGTIPDESVEYDCG